MHSITQTTLYSCQQQTCVQTHTCSTYCKFFIKFLFIASNALHLLLAGLSAAPRFLHVPGKANPADIPSRVPFVRRDGSHALDPDRLRPADARVVAALRVCYLPMVLPTAAQLGNLEYFIRRGAG